MSALPALRVLVGVCIIGAQLVFVGYVHLSGCCKERYFVWAPNDYSIDYHLEATVNDHQLSDSEIRSRYRLAPDGFYQDPVQRLEGVLQRRELAYGANDRVHITLRYELNGRPAAPWEWRNG